VEAIRVKWKPSNQSQSGTKCLFYNKLDHTMD
jgi:hypothetical protein